MDGDAAKDAPDDVTDAGRDRRSDLPRVVRRLALDPAFGDAVSADPLTALRDYRLTADDLSALAVWLERRAPEGGVRDLFDDPDR